MLLASAAQAMDFPPPNFPPPSKENDNSSKENQFDVAWFMQQIAQQAQAYDPYAGLPLFEKEVSKIVDSTKASEEKKADIISLIGRKDLEASYEEKVNSVLKFFPSSIFPNNLFSEKQCIDISNVLAHQNPIGFFNMCNPCASSASPSATMLDPGVKRAILASVSDDYFEILFNSQIDMEKRLIILHDILQSGNDKTLIHVFNKYLDLKKEFNAPYLPASFLFIETDQDFIAEFYALYLASRVPDILMDQALNLDLKERLTFANRYKDDFFAGQQSHRKDVTNYTTPQSLLDFYKFATTCKDTPLTINERFKALEQLLVLSEGKEKQIILDILQNPEEPFILRHKLSHLGKHATDGELQEKGNAFIISHQEEIQTDAKDRYNQLSVHVRMGIPALRQAGASGKGVTVAVCDGGFFKILPQDIYASNLMKRFANDEKSYQWKMLHGGKILSPQIFDEEWLTEVKNFSFPYHGSEMIDSVVTIADEVNVVPVAVHTNSSKSLIDSFNYLAGNKDVNIISCSFMLPAESADLESELKKGILNCLGNNKLFFLSVGNHGAYIPDDLSTPEPSAMNMAAGSGLVDLMDPHRMQEGLRVVNDLFKGEAEDSPIFSNLILVGSSKANSLEPHKDCVKPGNGLAQKQFVYLDADEMKNFFDDKPCWGGTSAATAMAAGIAATLWSEIPNPDANTATRVARALLENTNVDESIPVEIRGRGKVNAEKALENLEKY